MSEYLDVAIKAVKEGGELALTYFDKGIEVRWKSNDSEVTEADEKTEALIKKIILKAFPDHSFLGEESGATEGNEYLWVVDPIDGTAHFVRGMPGWGTQVALMKGDELIVSAAFLPIEDTLVHAEKGEGCFVNGQRAAVVEKPLERSRILHEMLTCFTKAGKTDGLLALAEKAQAVACMPMRHAYIAFLRGKIDATITVGVHPWDVLPWALMGQEAGAKVTSIGGGPLTRTNTTIVMAAPELQTSILSFFK